MNPADHSWFYAENDQQQGPVPFEEIQRRVATGGLPAHTLIWCQGQADWLPYRDVVAQASTTPVIGNVPGAVTLPQGPAEPEAAPLPIPATLKRANFAKLMTVSIIAFVLLFATGFLFAFAMMGSSGREVLAILAGLVAIAALGMLIWAVVIAMIYVYRAWLMIQAFGASCTPGLAVGLQFIPVFTLYWAFRAYYGWARDYNNAIRTDPRLQGAPRATEGAFLAFCICNAAAFPFNLLSNIPSLELIAGGIDALLTLASLALMIIVFLQICGAINFFVDARDRDTAGRGGAAGQF